MQGGRVHGHQPSNQSLQALHPLPLHPQPFLALSFQEALNATHNGSWKQYMCLASSSPQLPFHLVMSSSCFCVAFRAPCRPSPRNEGGGGGKLPPTSQLPSHLVMSSSCFCVAFRAPCRPSPRRVEEASWPSRDEMRLVLPSLA